MGAVCKRCGESAFDATELIAAGRELGLRVDSDGTIRCAPSEAARVDALENRKGFECTRCHSIYCMGCLLVVAPPQPGGGKACIACRGKFRRLVQYEVPTPPIATATSAVSSSNSPVQSQTPTLPLATPDTGTSDVVAMTTALAHYDSGLRNLCKSQGNKSSLWYGEAIRDLTKSLETNSRLVHALARRATCFTQTGEASKAAADLERIREIESDSTYKFVPDRSAARFHVETARRGIDSCGLISDTLYHVQKAIDADPSLWEAFDTRSDIYSTLGMSDEALTDIGQVGKLKRANSSSSHPAPNATPIDRTSPARKGFLAKLRSLFD